MPALVGRMFTDAVGLWQRHFGGAATVVGVPLVIERIPFTIVGVMAKAGHYDCGS